MQKCQRCGIAWEIHPSRKPNIYCESCRARRMTKVSDCLPWHGRFGADQLTPIHDDGKPVLVGKRVCGYSDCVNREHIERA